MVYITDPLFLSLILIVLTIILLVKLFIKTGPINQKFACILVLGDLGNLLKILNEMNIYLYLKSRPKSKNELPLLITCKIRISSYNDRICR
jgi:hypothetical protein